MGGEAGSGLGEGLWEGSWEVDWERGCGRGAGRWVGRGALGLCDFANSPDTDIFETFLEIRISSCHDCNPTGEKTRRRDEVTKRFSVGKR